MNAPATNLWLSDILRTNGRMDIGVRGDEIDSRFKELQQANSSLREYATVVCHELQEPLSTILSLSNLLENNGEAEVQDEISMRISKTARRMQGLVGGLLIYSRLCQERPSFAIVDMNHILNEVREDLYESLRASGGEIEVQSLPQLEADPLQMHQLLRNLIGNAIKYRRPGVTPRIRVQAMTVGSPDHCTISVSDNGIGFSEEQRSRLFHMFSRLHSAPQYQGTGIGLALCKKIAESHGGSIEASGVPGQGSIFRVLLPLRQNAA